MVGTAFLAVAFVIAACAQPNVGGLICAPSTVTGPYGYAISGYVAVAMGSAVPFSDQGTFVADGNGSFAGSSTVSTNGTIANRSISGNYAINSACAGTATFRDTLGNAISMAFTVVANGQEIQFIETDSGTVVSGVAQVGATGCDSTLFSGPFEYAISGFTLTGPFADSGRIVADGRGGFTGISTFSAAGLIQRRTFSGTYSLGSDCSGTATLVDSLGNSATLAIAAVNYGQDVLFIETDTGTDVAGRASRAQYACSNASVSGAYSYSITGYLDSNSTLTLVADAGLLTSDGNGNVSGSDSISETGVVQSRMLSGYYSVGTDCTGSIVLGDSLGNAYHFDLFVGDGGNHIAFIQTNNGAVTSGEAQNQAGACTNATISGAYGYAIEGWLVSTAGAEPFADSGQLTGAAGPVRPGAFGPSPGTFSGSSMVSRGGSIVSRTLTGTYQTSPNCSGSATLRGNLGNTANLSFVVSSDGHQLTFVETDFGTVISGGAQQLLSPVRSILNAASSVPGAIAPGEIVTIKGSGLGPAQGLSFSIDPNTSQVDTALAGTRVFFGGFGAPITYTSATQVNAIVPYEVASMSQVQMQVQYQGVYSSSTTLQIASAAPAAFTFNATGVGQAVAANQDGSLNGPSNPAASGSYVTIYFTGGGQTNPPGVTGSVNGSVLKRLSQSISVIVGGALATVTFAGAAPALVDGVGQLNIQLAASTPTGVQPIVITVGGVSSPTVATLAIF